MNRFVKTALAIAVAGSAAQAGTGDNEWSALDSEISGLALSRKQADDGKGWSVLLRAVYSYSSDEIAVGGDSSNPDLSGFGFNDVDVAFWGNQGPFTWRLSADLDRNEPVVDGTGTKTDQSKEISLEDAYVRWNCSYVDTTIGNFKPRVSRSNSVDPEHQLFIDRSALGSSFDKWDQGISISGAWEAMLFYYLALMNGFGPDDDGGDHIRDHFYLGRLEWNIGTGAGDFEGAMGSTEAFNGTAGLSFLHDDSVGQMVGDTNAWLADLHGSVYNWGFGGEVAEINDDYVGWRTSGDFNNIFSSSSASDGSFLALAEDSRPWNVYLSYLINPELEVAVRYEDLDNDIVNGSDPDGDDNTLVSFGLNWYRDGAAGKWQVQYTKIKADETNAPEGSILEIGYSVGGTR